MMIRRILSSLALLGAPALGFGGDTELLIPLPANTTLLLKALPAGTFTMGTEDQAHRVTLSRGFHMTQGEVTQGQWQALMGQNPSQFSGDPQRPVERVTWEAAQRFIQVLNKATSNQRPAGTSFRLPTEAEWEYACRAGSTTAFSFGDNAGMIGSAAWEVDSASYTTHPSGRKQANAWGLQDMHGNVSEWCQDWFGPYGEGPQTDPSGPATGTFRVVRGGSWAQPAEACASAARSLLPPTTATDRTGFRVVLARP